MNTTNMSTGFSPFMLKTGRAPCVIPPCVTRQEDPEEDTDELERAATLVKKLDMWTLEAKDSLLMVKISQAHHMNTHRGPETVFKVGEKVMLATGHQRREYLQAKSGQVAKFMPRFDGPYEVMKSFPETSDYMLELPRSSKVFPTFHSSHL